MKDDQIIKNIQSKAYDTKIFLSWDKILAPQTLIRCALKNKPAIVYKVQNNNIIIDGLVNNQTYSIELRALKENYLSFF